MSHDLEDRVQWAMSKSGKFSIKSLYDALEPGDVVLFQGISFRALALLRGCVFFTWEVMWGKALNFIIRKVGDGL